MIKLWYICTHDMYIKRTYCMYCYQDQDHNYKPQKPDDDVIIYVLSPGHKWVHEKIMKVKEPSSSHLTLA